MINEVDYDQVGADGAGFVEIANTGDSAASLDALALVLVNGGDGTEYARTALTGTLAPGAYLVARRRPAERRAGRSRARGHDRRNAPRRSLVRGRDPGGHDRRRDLRSRRGTALPAATADSNTQNGSLARLPDGQDTNDAAADWKFTATPTPGAANVPS